MPRPAKSQPAPAAPPAKLTQTSIQSKAPQDACVAGDPLEEHLVHGVCSKRRAPTQTEKAQSLSCAATLPNSWVETRSPDGGSSQSCPYKADWGVRTSVHLTP